MPSSSQPSPSDNLQIFATAHSQAFVLANTAPGSEDPKLLTLDLGNHHKATAAEASPDTTSVKWAGMVNLRDPCFSMSRLAMNAAPCLRCLFFIQDGDPTRLCLNYIWKDNGAKGCLECVYDGKGGSTPTETVSSQLRLARHYALQALLGGIKDPAEALELADINVLYSVHRSHEREERAMMRKEMEQAERKEKRKGKKPKHRGNKTDSGKGAAGKSDGETATELPVSDTYPSGFGIQLAHVVLLRKIWRQNQTTLVQLEAQSVLLSALMRGEVQAPSLLSSAYEEMVKSVKLSCEVLEKLLEKFEVQPHGLNIPDKLRKAAMEL
ncbi:uncharacterized protein TRIREDRAFT_109323 [Trichoderma reesei QM6a]|uniref:Predicted protein n=2 Tax=Hypocrea jecorina TaxID=51453 RepID=G0RPD2_HYPJQ|nr:uncharacterized protein TRIREDRAFT_109323 [Trichoderma reesei QM6a]EGR46984.1 predicted protein [Trichoderma reesei QM6a]ETR99729.1 hypothetical protein M419DRAFT_37415 [Trichoderma reesei RUT C-30]